VGSKEWGPESKSWADPKSGPGARHFDAPPPPAAATPLAAATPATPTSSHAAAGTTTGKLPKEELKVRTDLTIADIAAVDAVKHDAVTGQPDSQPRFAGVHNACFDTCPQPITSDCYLKCYQGDKVVRPRFVEVHRASQLAEPTIADIAAVGSPREK
jgi:hypothetical protein